MKRLFIVGIFFVFVFVGKSHAQTLVSPFAGSEPVGEYSTQFEKLAIAENADIKNMFTVEGGLVSNLYRKPMDKSEFEVFRSYEAELKASGFTFISNSTDKRKNHYVINQLYRKENNYLTGRKYNISTKKQMSHGVGGVQFSSDYYLAAKKQINDKTYYVVIAVSNKDNMYMVEVLEVDEMETGTVKISEELLKKKIGAEGKYLIYSIYFDTGKAEILPTSNETLEIISNYLKNASGNRFYIVGHTDDTGNLANNMDLSERRANEVVRALQVRYGVSQNQLEAKGVGPLAPIDSNETEKGRTLNRRVELVLRLE